MATRRKEQAQMSNNLAVGIIFCLVIAVLIIGSISLKFFDLVRKSSFNGKHRFTLAVSDSSQNPGDTIYIVSFSPETESTSLLLVPEFYKTGETTKILDASTVGKQLLVPVDAYVVNSNATIHLTKYGDNQKDVGVLIKNVVFSLNSTKTSLTMLDALYLFMYSRSLSQNTTTIAHLEGNMDEGAQNKLLASLFADTQLTNDKETIAVINGTDTPGLASKLATLLSNLGANVVSVTNSEATRSSSLTYTGQMSYTVKKLSGMLNMKATPSEDRGVSTIVIRIGSDKQNSSSF